MQTIEIIVGILSCVIFLGIVILIGMDKEVDILMPSLTVLIGYIVGRRQDDIVRVFSRQKK